jgi:ABC-2 type transport system ATP-binding protein
MSTQLAADALIAEDRLPREVVEPAGTRLCVEGVTKHWGERLVLDSVDLSTRAGELAALVGVNGAGKTTLLRIVGGLIYPEEGTVQFDSIDLRSQRRTYLRRVGFVSAGQTGLYARLTVQDHLEYWARIAFIPRRSRQQAIEKAIERFDLGELRERRSERLSMGQRQRVRLAMCLMHEPSLLLLDEPRTSLDAAGTEVLRQALTTSLAAGATVIWCAPDVDDPCVQPDTVYRLTNGRLVAE